MEDVKEIPDKESERVEGIRKAFQSELVELEVRLVEKDEVLRTKNSAIQELEVELEAKIHSLQKRRKSSICCFRLETTNLSRTNLFSHQRTGRSGRQSRTSWRKRGF